MPSNSKDFIPGSYQLVAKKFVSCKASKYFDVCVGGGAWLIMGRISNALYMSPVARSSFIIAAVIWDPSQFTQLDTNSSYKAPTDQRIMGF